MAVSTHLPHVCALTTAGEAVCFSSYWRGTRGFAYTYEDVTPTPGSYTAISAGKYRACALTEAGEVACWGSLMADRFFPDTGWWLYAH